MKTKSHCRQLYDALLPIVTQLRGILDERELSARSKEKLEMIKTELAIIARWNEKMGGKNTKPKTSTLVHKGRGAEGRGDTSGQSPVPILLGLV